MIERILTALGFKATKTTEPETLSDITAGFEAQIEKMKARVEFDKESIEAKNKEQLRLEMEKQILEGDVSRGERMINKFSDLIA